MTDADFNELTVFSVDLLAYYLNRESYAIYKLQT